MVSGSLGKIHIQYAELSSYFTLAIYYLDKDHLELNRNCYITVLTTFSRFEITNDVLPSLKIVVRLLDMIILLLLYQLQPLDIPTKQKLIATTTWAIDI